MLPSVMVRLNGLTLLGKQRSATLFALIHVALSAIVSFPAFCGLTVRPANSLCLPRQFPSGFTRTTEGRPDKQTGGQPHTRLDVLCIQFFVVSKSCSSKFRSSAEVSRHARGFRDFMRSCFTRIQARRRISAALRPKQKEIAKQFKSERLRDSMFTRPLVRISADTAQAQAHAFLKRVFCCGPCGRR